MSFVIPAVTSVEIAAASKFAWKTFEEYQDKNPPVQNTEYTVFDADGGVKLVSISAIQTNTETNAKEIDCIITMDGITWTYDASVIGAMTNNQRGSFVMLTNEGGGGTTFLDLVGNVTLPHDLIRTLEGGKPLEGHEIKVVLRMTSAAGTAQRLKYQCVYKKLEAV